MRLTQNMRFGVIGATSTFRAKMGCGHSTAEAAQREKPTFTFIQDLDSIEPVVSALPAHVIDYVNASEIFYWLRPPPAGGKIRVKCEMKLEVEVVDVQLEIEVQRDGCSGWLVITRCHNWRLFGAVRKSEDFPPRIHFLEDPIIITQVKGVHNRLPLQSDDE